MSRGNTCSVENCEIKTKYGDICEKHRWRFSKHGSYDLPKKELKLCRAPECKNTVDFKQSSLLCTMHRVRWSRHKSFDLPIKENLPKNIVKVCKEHGQLTADLAYQVPSNPKWWQCRLCKQINAIKFSEKHPGRHRYQERKHIHVRSNGDKLKLTVEEYREIFEKQNNSCAICKEKEVAKSSNSKKYDKKPVTIKRLAIDHCHVNGNIRGLLCQHCNQGLGNFRDSIELLESAILYLKENS